MPSDAPDPAQVAGGPDVERDAARRGEADAWGAFGLVVSGVLVWGGVGWFVSERTGSQVPLLVGLLVGMFAGLYLVWFRYGRS